MHKFDIWNHQIKLEGIKWFMVKMPFCSARCSQVAGDKCVNALMQETYWWNNQNPEMDGATFTSIWSCASSDECSVMASNIHGLVNVKYLWETHFALQLWKQQRNEEGKDKKAEVQVLVVIYFYFVSLI